MTSSLRFLLRKIILTGCLRLTDHGGQMETYGDGSGPPVAIRVTDLEAEEAIARDPALKLGEMYMEGRMLLEEGDIYDFLALVKANTRSEALSWRMIVLTAGRIVAEQLRTRLPLNRNRRNVAHHYDLDARLFALFLDDDWQYSCAYFNPPGLSLDEAQTAKKRHIAAKLLLSPGQTVLEIGSGWGGMAMYLAEAAKVDVTGITLSEEQLRVSCGRVLKRGLTNSVHFKLQDYQTLPPQTYDRIVSVGMFEHVGIGHYGTFFRKAAAVLDENGVMVLHAIGRPRPSYATNPFIEKYIFPGGYIPAVGEVLPAIENAGLLVRDVEILPLHYGYTLREWRKRFTARKAEVLALYDERFFRMWEFYLAGSEMAFFHEELFIFQIQIAHNQYAVPNNRDYIAEAESRYRQFEAGRYPLEAVEF